MTNGISNISPSMNSNWLRQHSACKLDNIRPEAPSCPHDTMACSQGFEQMGRYNPFAAFAMHVILVLAEAFSANRAPAQGMIARNDTLEGMLCNQGYSMDEIYGPNADGYTMLDMVAGANNLRNPNMLVPHRPMLLPTRYAPEFDGAVANNDVHGGTMVTRAQNQGQNSNACTSLGSVEGASIFTMADVFGTGVRANAETTIGKVKDSVVVTQATAQGNQVEANARTTVGRVENSVVVTEAIAQGPQAQANAQTTIGKVKDSVVVTQATTQGNQVEANARTTVGRVENSVVVTEAIAQGLQAQANAQTTIGTAQDSLVVTNAAADGTQVQAEAQTAIEHSQNSVVNTSATAEGLQTQASAETTVAQADSSTIVTEAAAEGPQAQAEAVSEIGTARDSEVASVATAEGADATAAAGTFVTEASNSTLQADATSTGGQAEAHVDNAGWEQGGQAVVNAQGTEGAHAEALGVEQAQVTATSENGTAAVVLDATSGEATLTGQDGVATVEGRNSQSSFDLDVQGVAQVHDQGVDGNFLGQSSGNSIDATVRGQDLEIRNSTSTAVDVTFQGREGDNLVVGNAPQGGETSRLDLNLGNGNDRVEVQRGASSDTALIEKSEGTLDLNLHNGVGMDDIGSNTTVIDAGKATVTGYVGGSQGDDLLAIRGADFSDLRISGGTGGNDQLVIDLQPGAAIPAVVTKEASGAFLGIFGGNAAEGALPANYQPGDQAISAPGFESVVIRQNGVVVGGTEGATVPASFDQLLANARV